jgi:hypothetical protein
VDAIAFWLMSVVVPDFDGLDRRTAEMSDWGLTGGLGFAVCLDFTADGSDLRAINGCWGAGFPVSTCFAGGLVFLAVWEWIFLRTTFGAAALSAGWSQLSKTAKKPIKQAKLQTMVRCFFIMAKKIFSMDVKTCIGYRFIIIFSFSFSF